MPFTPVNYFRGGDHVPNAIGVLGFDFSLYRIYPTAPATYTSLNSQPAITLNQRLATVAAHYTLNFFLTVDTTTPTQSQTVADSQTSNVEEPMMRPINYVQLRVHRQRTKLL